MGGTLNRLGGGRRQLGEGRRRFSSQLPQVSGSQHSQVAHGPPRAAAQYYTVLPYTTVYCGVLWGIMGNNEAMGLKEGGPRWFSAPPLIPL